MGADGKSGLTNPIDEPPPEIDTFIYSEGVIITMRGKRVDLTRTHCAILARLMKRMTASEYHAASHADLAEAIWGPAACWPEQWKDDVHEEVSLFRRRLRKAELIQTVVNHVGFGYRLTGRFRVEA